MRRDRGVNVQDRKGIVHVCGQDRRDRAGTTPFLRLRDRGVSSRDRRGIVQDRGRDRRDRRELALISFRPGLFSGKSSTRTCVALVCHCQTTAPYCSRARGSHVICAAKQMEKAV